MVGTQAIVTGGQFDRQFYPMSVLSITIFPKEIRLFLGVFSAGLLVINYTFGIMLNSCGNLYFNTLTFASLVCLCRGALADRLCAPVWELSALKHRPVEHASWILNTPDFEYVPVVIIPVCWCHLDRNKYSR